MKVLVNVAITKNNNPNDPVYDTGDKDGSGEKGMSLWMKR